MMPDQQDVALGQLDLVVLTLALGVQALVVVVDRDRQGLLRALLTDHVVVQDVVDFLRLWQLAAGLCRGPLLHLLADDVVAQFHALVADIDRRPGD
jgi:hypothetical protein